MVFCTFHKSDANPCKSLWAVSFSQVILITANGLTLTLRKILELYVSLWQLFLYLIELVALIRYCLDIWFLFLALIFVCLLWIENVLQFLLWVVCKESQPLYLETKVFFSYFWYNLLFGYLVEDFLVCSQLSWYKTFCETLWMFISVLWVVFWKHWSYINNFILEFYIDKNFWWFKLWKFIYS